MPVAPVQPAEMARVQGELYRDALATQPPPANVEAATVGHDDGLLLYRGRTYRLRPVPYRVGVRLQVLDFELRQLHLYEPTPEVAAQCLAILDEYVALLDALIIRPWWHRRLKPHWSLFHDAEEGELREMAGFFSPARTRFPVSVRASAQAPAWVLRTSPTPSDSLRVGTRAGWRQTATRAAIATSSSDSSRSPGKPSAPADWPTP